MVHAMDDILATVTMTVAAPVEALWRVLTDFGRPQRLAPTIMRCTVTGMGVGAVRIVESSRGLTIHERLVLCDPAAWRFGYEVLDSGDMPFAGVTRYVATVTLTPIDAAHTTIDWRAEGRVSSDPAPVTAAITALYESAIACLAYEARTQSARM